MLLSPADRPSRCHRDGGGFAIAELIVLGDPAVKAPTFIRPSRGDHGGVVEKRALPRHGSRRR